VNKAAALGAAGMLWAAALGASAQARASDSEDAAGRGIGQVLAPQRISARVRLDYFQSSSSLDHQDDFLGGTLQVKALPRWGDSIDAKMEARLAQPDVRGRPGYGPAGQLLEGYTTLHFGHADLRLGKQILAWGRADGINPTDNLTPRNYRVLLPLEEDQRFGTVSARIEAYLSQTLTLDIFASPWFEPDRIPLAASSQMVETRKPAHSPASTEAGVRLNKVGGGFDWSVSYYDGYGLLPVVGAGAAGLQLSYERSDILGADCAWNLGRFGLRSELAYTRPRYRSGGEPNSARSRLFWVAGVDRTFFEEFNVNLQGFVRWMPRYQDPASFQGQAIQRAATLNAMLGGQESGLSPGMTFRVSNLWWNDSLRAEILGITNFTRGDGYLRPLLSYDFNDHLRVSLGANLHRGSRTTQYGALRPDSGALAELRYDL
jgi:hypothetical protein